MYIPHSRSAALPGYLDTFLRQSPKSASGYLFLQTLVTPH